MPTANPNYPFEEDVIKEIILRVGVPSDKYTEDYVSKLHNSIKRQVEEYDIIPIIVPEDVTLETVYV